MITKANGALSFPIRVTLFRQNFYAIVLQFVEQNIGKEGARELTNEALTVLWEQPMVHDPEETQAGLLFFVWLYIACKVNPNLECN